MKTSPSISVLLSSFSSALLLFCPDARADEGAGDVISEMGSTINSTAPSSPTTLRLLVHNNPPMVEYVQQFNENYESMHPNVAIDLKVVDPSDIDTVTRESIDNGTVDIIDIFGFANEVTEYMKGNVKLSSSSSSWPDETVMPLWQNLVLEGKLLDLTDQPFLSNYYTSALEDAGSYEGRVYAVNLGITSYSGMYVNKNMLETLELDVPETFNELEAACSMATAEGGECMIVGGRDLWPLWVGTYGLLGSIWSDPEAFVEGLWTGKAKWNDPNGLEFLRKVQTYSNIMLAENTTKSLPSSGAAAWFAKGGTLFLPSGSWDASLIDAAGPEFDWTYVPFPGGDDKDQNQYLFGKYDQGWAIASDPTNKEEALAYFSEFSDPANYKDFITAVGFVPTQPINGTVTNQIVQDIMPYMNDDKFRVGFEQFWVKPLEAGAWAEAEKAASWFRPFGEWDDYVALADRAQHDLERGLVDNEIEKSSKKSKSGKGKKTHQSKSGKAKRDEMFE